MKRLSKMNVSSMFRKTCLGAAVACTLGAGAAWADDFSADINDDAFKFAYKTSGADAQLSWNTSVLVHDEDGEIYSLGAQVVGQSLQRSNVDGALGIRGYYVDLDNSLDGTAVGLGGALTFSVPQVQPLSIQLEGYFAPSVLAFGDLDRNVDISIRALYRILTNGSVYLGYRKANVEIETDFASADVDVDESLHLGIQLKL